MSDAVEILKIEKPHFTIRVYNDVLKVDLKGTFKNDLEEALENIPIFRETIGNILEIFAPLHVRLSDIDSVRLEKTGKVAIRLPRHRDLAFPLDMEDAKKLVDKLNELILPAKERELTRIMKEQRLKRIGKAEHELLEENVFSTSGGAQFLMPTPPGVREKEREATEEQERKDEQ